MPASHRYAPVLLVLAVMAPAVGARRVALKADALDQGANVSGWVDASPCGGLTPEGVTLDLFQGTWISNMQPFLKDSNVKKCDLCLSQAGKTCKWCPVDQRCRPQGTSCPVRPGGPQQKDKGRKVKSADKCGDDDHASPLEEEMVKFYGTGWRKDESKHADRLRCISWSLGWPMIKDPNYKDDGDLTQQENQDLVGSWACTSAMMREGIVRMLGKDMAREENETNIISIAQLAQASSPSLLEERAGEASNSSHWPRDQEITWEPGLCSFLRMKKGGKCYVRNFFLKDFAKLWQQEAQPKGRFIGESVQDLLAKSAMSGPLVSFKPGAGKSGSGFSRTWDNKFKVKLGLKYNSKMNEPDNLVKLVTLEGAKTGAAKLYDHFKSNPDSLLNRMYGMLKIASGDMRSYAVVLADAFYYMEGDIQEQGAAVQRYDLKGESRNQDEETVKGFTLVNGDFRKLEQNRLQLTHAQSDSLLAATRKDTAFLQRHDIIDYSILLMAVDRGANRKVSCARTPGEPFCLENGNRLYTMNIIDYLNDYTAAKVVESFFRGGKFDRYDQKTNNYVAKICSGDVWDQLYKKLVDKYQSIRNAFLRPMLLHSEEALDLEKVSEEEALEKVSEVGPLTPGDLLDFWGFDIKGISEEEQKLVLNLLDNDRNGKVSLEEFMRAFDA